MPRYATVAQVQEALAVGQDVDEDTFPANAAGLDEDRLAERIEKAAADVDSSLWPAYATPFDPDPEVCPKLVSELTVALAVYFATVTYGEDDPLGEDHPVRQNYQWARSRMADIVAGRGGLPGVARVTRRASDFGAESGGIAGAPRNPHSRLFSEDRELAGARPRVPVHRPWLGW